MMRKMPLFSIFLVLSLALSITGVWADSAEVAYIIKRPAGDKDVAITFSYDKESEEAILERIGGGGRILNWQVQCTGKYLFYRPFHFQQGDLTTRPVLCLVKKYLCNGDVPEGGYVYTGYLYLGEDFDLREPIIITLADKVVKARFIP